jgi:hypothetical protein
MPGVSVPCIAWNTHLRTRGSAVRIRPGAPVSVPTDNGQPFAADGGITHAPAVTSRDPFEALDDLMTVIEALCPVWPHREIFLSTDRFLI